MSQPAHLGLSYDAYVDLERETDVRHEFLDGRVWAMSGGTPRHSALKANLTAALSNDLRGASCRLYDSDLKVRVLATGLATYPDASVVCGPLALHPDDRNAVTNPSLLVEVLSESTERWDRAGKFAHYRRVESLRHYVLVVPDQVRVEHFARQDDGSWRLTFLGPGDVLDLPDLGVRVPVDEVYRDLPEPNPGDRLSGERRQA